MRQRVSPVVAPFAMTIREFMQYYPICRAAVAKAIQCGELESFVDGNRRLIAVEAARRYAAAKAAKGGAVPPEVSAKRAAAGRKGRAAQLAVISGDSAESPPSPSTADR